MGSPISFCWLPSTDARRAAIPAPTQIWSRQRSWGTLCHVIPDLVPRVPSPDRSSGRGGGCCCARTHRNRVSHSRRAWKAGPYSLDAVPRMAIFILIGLISRPIRLPCLASQPTFTLRIQPCTQCPVADSSLAPLFIEPSTWNISIRKERLSPLVSASQCLILISVAAINLPTHQSQFENSGVVLESTCTALTCSCVLCYDTM
jgi:hypothetical protein